MRKKEILQRVGEKFDREIKGIARERRVTVDINYPKEIGFERLTNKIPDLPEWKIMKQRLLKEPRKEEIK